MFLFINLFFICCSNIVFENDMGVKQNNKFFLENNNIYYDGKRYAELRYFKDGVCIRGFAIYYYEDNKEIWINPKQGWQVENFVTGEKVTKISHIEKIWNSGNRNIRLLLGNKVPSKEELISSCSFDIKVSNDGIISYKTRGILFTSTHKYLIKERKEK